MGKQGTKAIFVGTCANLNGYVDDGKPFARLVDRRDRRKAGALAASKVFGRVSGTAAKVWGQMPVNMRRLGGECAYNEWVSACLGLAREGSYHWDWRQLEGLRFGEGKKAKGDSMDFPVPLDLTEGIHCWEAPSQTALVTGIRTGKLDLSGALASVRMALKPYQKGVDAHWRLGAMPRRDGHYDLGTQLNPHRGPAQRYEGSARDRAWNAAHAKGMYQGYAPELVDHFGEGYWTKGSLKLENFRSGKSTTVPLAQGELRVRFWLHAAAPEGRRGLGVCTDWYRLDSAVAPVLDVCSLRDGVDQRPGDAEWLVFLGVEVSEKRCRHWVRLPFACGLTCVGVVCAGDLEDARLRPSGRRRAQSRVMVRGGEGCEMAVLVDVRRRRVVLGGRGP
ncbi:MAG TPA: hypothetical protein VHS96_08995 [Bacteroidia bacterium]|nr:hypothetical protein [Bacteroidia bacterium]